MPEINFRVNSRFAKFWANLKLKDFISFAFIGYTLGWILSFLIVISLIHLNFNLVLLILLFHGYFWFKLVDYIQKKILPPTELLIVLFLLIYLFEIAFLQSEYAISTFWFSAIQTSGTLLPTLQIFLLAFLILIFSLILVQNSQGKKGVIFWYLLLGVIGNNFLSSDGTYYLLFFQIILFILLLRKTSWLEGLTKIECWIYFVIVFFLFRGFSQFNLMHSIKVDQMGQVLILYSAPYYLYLLFKMYLLAVLVKIPVVLVYNHAQLSRKLWISSLFQSTFPQVIHLIMLVIIFYFFIAFWQAENVRQGLTIQIEQIKSGKLSQLLTYYKVAIGGSKSAIKIDGYQPLGFSEDFPDAGILALERDQSDTLSASQNSIDYFFFSKSSVTPKDSIYFVKLNSNFLELITNNISILAGTQLLAYPYILTQGESILYTINTWVEDNNIRIFPFSLIPKNIENTISVDLEEKTKSQEFLEGQAVQLETEDINIKILNKNEFSMGRVFVPLLDANLDQTGYFAFDVLLVPNISFLTSPLFRYIVVLIIIYLFVNLFVIRRVVKFGSQINRKIVQKFNQLKIGIREISTGNLDYKVRLEGEDEFVELAERFNQMGEKLKETIAEVREKERLEHELNIARQVQLSLLPPHLPNVPGFQIAATLKTATEVGGDFYDILPLNKNKFLFTIGDVSGKSTSAAFYMAQCISLIRYSPQFTYEPREIILRLNEYFADPMVDRQMFVTAIIGMLDAAKSTIRLVRAGHTLPILIPGRKKEQIRELQTAGLGIGLARSGQILEKILKVNEVPIHSGDLVVLYTDGVVEASRSEVTNNGENGYEMQFYGEDRLINLLNELRGKNAVEIMQALTNDLESFYAGNPPVDDYTLLIIQKTSK